MTQLLEVKWSFRKEAEHGSAIADTTELREDVISCLRKNIQQSMDLFIYFVSTVDRLGKFIVAGGAAVGLGALCYYGMGMSSEIGAIERAA